MLENIGRKGGFSVGDRNGASSSSRGVSIFSCSRISGYPLWPSFFVSEYLWIFEHLLLYGCLYKKIAGDVIPLHVAMLLNHSCGRSFKYKNSTDMCICVNILIPWNLNYFVECLLCLVVSILLYCDVNYFNVSVYDFNMLEYPVHF